MLRAFRVTVFFLLVATLYGGIALYLMDVVEGCFKLYTLRHDMTGDGLYTVSDLWAQLKWWFYLPGELLVSGLIRLMPSTAQFFEFSLAQCRDGLSFLVSGASWLVIFILLKVYGIDEPRRGIVTS